MIHVQDSALHRAFSRELIVYGPRGSNFKILCLVLIYLCDKKDNKYVYLLKKIFPYLWAQSLRILKLHRKNLSIGMIKAGGDAC